MKKFFYILTPIIAVMFSSCHKQLDTPDSRSESIVLAYPAVNNYNVASSGINYWNQAKIDFDMTKATSPVNISINLPKPSSQTITVNIGVDQAAFDSYKANPIYKTQYALMPATYYQIPNTKIDIPAGKTDTTFAITFKPSVMDITTTGYLLPISITSVSNGTTNAELKTIYFHIEKDPFPPYSRTAWTVTGFSSEEPKEATWGNGGQVIHMFDGLTNTFWHSKWDGGAPPPPHWFAVNMNASQVIHGFYFLPRQAGSNGRPKDMTVEVSNDGTTWTSAGTIKLADNSSWQKIPLSSPTAAVKYFKITITSLWGDPAAHVYTNLAELKVY